MNLSVKFGRETLALDLSRDSTVAELQEELEKLTGLMVRKQKLMAGGKVIGGRPGTLAAAGLKPGAKLMLLAAAGATSQGQAALEAARQGRQAALERGRQQLSERAWGGAGAGAAPAPSIAQRAETWAKTGIAALRDLKLTQLPGELFGAAVAAKLRVLDCGGNALSTLPPALGTLTALQRLRLSLNRLDDAGLPPQLLAGLRQLAILALDDNRLTTLPACVCGLAALQKLSLNGNQLASLPDGIASLAQLRVLALRGNRLAALPAALGGCGQLQELDVRDNQLAALPVELGRLAHLRLLLADNNRLHAVPSEILTGCTSLATLTLHGNPATAEALRELSGWAAFDERRRTKYDKQVDMKVLSGGFDEGADVNEFEHWK